MPNEVRVEGLSELRRALRAADEKLPGRLRDELKVLAGEVAEVARGRLLAQVQTSTGRAAASIRPGASGARAVVRAGGARVPYFGWLDFGGTIRHHGPRHTHNTVHLIRREFIAGGRFLYPAADQEADRIAPQVERLLESVFVQAGFTG